jgi:hypothetical protein
LGTYEANRHLTDARVVRPKSGKQTLNVSVGKWLPPVEVVAGR